MSLLKKCVPRNIISDMKLVLSTLNSKSAPTKVLSNIDDHLIANTESFLWPWNIILNPNISMEKSEKRIMSFCFIIATLMFMTITMMLLSFPIILIEHKPKIIVPKISEKNLFCKHSGLLLKYSRHY